MVSRYYIAVAIRAKISPVHVAIGRSSNNNMNSLNVFASNS